MTEKHFTTTDLPDCIGPGPDSPTLGIACEGCVPDCDTLAYGRQVLGLVTSTRELAYTNGLMESVATGLRHELAEAQATLETRTGHLITAIERILMMRQDSLIPTAFTPEGIRDLLTHDPTLGQEILRGNCGVIRLDGRFVEINNRKGKQFGDLFLQNGGAKLASVTDGLARTQTRRIADQDTDHMPVWDIGRLDFPGNFDLILREGGDEWDILVRNVSPPQLQTIAMRIASELNVEKALKRYAEKRPPFIASVGFAHARSIAGSIPDDTPQDAWSIFNAMDRLADTGQLLSKKAQYAEMWELVIDLLPAEVLSRYDVMPGTREISTLFLHYHCPDFVEDPAQYYLSP